MGMTPLRAVRWYCLECCGDSAAEVRQCVSKSCPLWPVRMGTRPSVESLIAVADQMILPFEDPATGAMVAQRSTIQRVKRRCLDCSDFSKPGVASCAFLSCPLHAYRKGHNPARAGLGGAGNPAFLKNTNSRASFDEERDDPT